MIHIELRGFPTVSASHVLIEIHSYDSLAHYLLAGYITLSLLQICIRMWQYIRVGDDAVAVQKKTAVNIV